MKDQYTDRIDTLRDNGATTRDPGYPGRRQGDFIEALTDAVRENPMSAALIGLGAAWLYMGGNRTSIAGGNGRTSLMGALVHGASDVGQGAAQAVGRVGSAVSAGVSNTAEGVSSAASKLGDYVRESVSGVDAEAAYRGSAVRDDDYTDQISDYTWRRDRRQNQGRFSLGRVQQNMQDIFERHPVVIGLAGLAVGAGIAASLPVSRKEQQVMGRVGEALQDQIGEVAERARVLVDAAADEARQHGLGVDTARNAVEELRSRAGSQ